MKIVISSGHGKLVRGASDYIDEVDEARRVVNRVASYLNNVGVGVEVFHDDVSTTQDANLNRIVNFHNSKQRDLDVSVHFNAYETTSSPMGTECLYVTQDALAQKVATKISQASGLKNRGPKKRTDLFFLNNTERIAIMIEVCFVDSRADVELYEENFDAICAAIGGAISGVETPLPEPEPPTTALFTVTGKVSSFGGPDDEGVSPTEGLAFITRMDQAPQLFLPFQPRGTSGLARRLNPYVHYIACRWDYDTTPKSMMLEQIAIVRAPKTGISLKAFPADWGPHESTGRVADLSPSLMDDLGIKTDDQVEVTFPA
jgi:N-acetylmuramoyl-L-alanine amidase